MALQTNYPDTQSAAVAGAQATEIPATLISRNVEDAVIGFGKPVEQGDTDKGMKLFAGGSFVGVTLLDRSASGFTVVDGQITGRTPDAFGIGESARVMVRGDVWVVASVAVAAGDPVHVTAAGAFSNTGGTAINARWDTSASANGLAVIRLGDASTTASGS